LIDDRIIGQRDCDAAIVSNAAGVSLITYYSSTVATRAVINRQEMAARWEHRAVGDGQSCANTAGVI